MVGSCPRRCHLFQTTQSDTGRSIRLHGTCSAHRRPYTENRHCNSCRRLKWWRMALARWVFCLYAWIKMILFEVLLRLTDGCFQMMFILYFCRVSLGPAPWSKVKRRPFEEGLSQGQERRWSAPTTRCHGLCLEAKTWTSPEIWIITTKGKQTLSRRLNNQMLPTASNTLLRSHRQFTCNLCLCLFHEP